MKTAAYTALHYGKPYLGAAIQSVIDSVDEYIMLYSPTPSHNGGVASLPCPDSESDLYDIAKMAAGNKLKWVRGNWKYENQQRAAVHEHASDADVILILDSDEIWPAELVRSALTYPLLNPGFQNWRVPIIHYWRSFYRAVLHDPAYPIRVINPRGNGEAYVPSNQRINHMGYALPYEYVAYKWSGIHGHQGELRRDCDWLKDVYLANRQTDCHPVGSEWWNPEMVNPWMYMPEFMRYHQFSGMEIIE